MKSFKFRIYTTSLTVQTLDKYDGQFNSYVNLLYSMSLSFYNSIGAFFSAFFYITAPPPVRWGGG